MGEKSEGNWKNIKAESNDFFIHRVPGTILKSLILSFNSSIGLSGRSYYAHFTN